MIPEDLDFEGDEPTLKHHFEVIPPGGSSKWFNQPGTDEYAVLDVYNPAAKFQRAHLTGKKVFLQLELNHLRFPKSQADELTVRWARLRLPLDRQSKVDSHRDLHPEVTGNLRLLARVQN